MRITIKEIIDLLKEHTESKGWGDYDDDYEFSCILDFGALRHELENSWVLSHFLDKNGIDMVFDNTGTHFIKL